MKLSSIARINLTIVAVCITAVLLVSVLGFLPDERSIRAANRASAAETLATSLTHLVAKFEYRQADTQLELFAKRNPDVISAGLRRQDGELMATAGEHERLWQSGLRENKDSCYVVPIMSGRGEWGAVELEFTPLYQGLSAFVNPALVKLIGLLAPLIGFATWLHLRKVLKYLDPTQVVPTRVRQTLDSFSEGVVLLDSSNDIVLVNEAFTASLRMDAHDLMGQALSDLHWRAEAVDGDAPMPWEVTYQSQDDVHGQTISIEVGDASETVVFSVNCTPVLDERGNYQGAMVVFADVTPLERKRAELAFALEELNRSQDEIQKQNCELRYLATRDPLTGCINRRTFFDSFEDFWQQSVEAGQELSVMMVDVDFFKHINDNYGHSMGDEVLRQTGALLNRMARPVDVVCRYGGEEFSVLMPGSNLDGAAELAEAIREELSRLVFDGFKITASLGVSAHSLGAKDPQDLLDQADKCLYVAKRNGRNRVIRFDTVPADLVVDESKISRTKVEETASDHAAAISYATVSALLSALSFRDLQTGLHCVRVANYAAELAAQSLSPTEVNIIEMAGLLHDMGKIGIPDAILLKPGRLSEQEWKVMERHDVVGVEIVDKAFKHRELADIVRYHHCRWDGEGADPDQPSGEAIPLGARILAIADAFDAMISDRPYRRGMTIDSALAELKRCAGSQFDPVLADQFCELVSAGRISLHNSHVSVNPDTAVEIGEHMQKLLEAVVQGNKESVLESTERLGQVAEQSQLLKLATAVTAMKELAKEDNSLDQVVGEVLGLMSICRELHEDVADVSGVTGHPRNNITVDTQAESRSSIIPIAPGQSGEGEGIPLGESLNPSL